MMTQLFSYGISGLAVLLGGGSLLYFFGFVFWGPFKTVVISNTTQMSLLIDSGLSIIFFLQHSLMIRKSFRDRITRIIPDYGYSAFYAITSGLTLISVIVFWQKTDYLLVEFDGIGYWMLRLLSLTAIAGFYWGSRVLGGFDPFGIRSISKRRSSDKPKPTRFKVLGPYRWVRHPLYTFTLIMIWSYPYITSDRLLFNVLWTVWIVLGTFFEEKDLVGIFGDKYTDYQSRVPMLVPFKRPVRPKN